MGTNLIGELVANNGTYILADDETTYNGKVDQVIVRSLPTEQVRVQLFVGDGDVKKDVTDEYLSAGIQTKLSNGTRITPKGDQVFSAVKLISNSTDGGLELVLAA